MPKTRTQYVFHVVNLPKPRQQYSQTKDDAQNALYDYVLRNCKLILLSTAFEPKDIAVAKACLRLIEEGEPDEAAMKYALHFKKALCITRQTNTVVVAYTKSPDEL